MSRKIQQKSKVFSIKKFWTSYAHRYPHKNGLFYLCTSCGFPVEKNVQILDFLCDQMCKFQKNPVNAMLSYFHGLIHLFT